MGSRSQGGSYVYVASPLGFSEIGRDYQDRVVLPALRQRGYEVLDPWHDEGGEIATRLEKAASILPQAERMDALQQLNEELGQRNTTLLERCDAVLALLDGPDVDSGTAAEIGYACALGRPVVGWRSDLREAGENHGTPVNLQVAYFVARNGGRVAPNLQSALDELAAVLGS